MKLPDPSFVIKSIVAGKDLAAAHTELLRNKSMPAGGGLRQVHLFRIERDNKTVEYWDVSQMVSPDFPNPDGAF